MILLAYTALRAHLLSLTHDECGSFDIWLHFNIFTCHHNLGCWDTANLHWLYVLMMKASVGLFGESELTIRLPALLGHGLYLIFSYKLVKNLPGEAADTPPWLFLCGFLLLNLNPYLLEFFSLARGYGLAMGLMMMSLYFFASYTDSGRTRHFVGAIGAATLAVLANFTQLNYLACLLAVSAVVVLPRVFSEKNAWKKRLLPVGSVALAACGLLYGLLRKPIHHLRQRGEFEYGADTFWDSVRSLIRASLYHAKYLKMYNSEVFAFLLALLFIAALLLAATRFFRKPAAADRRFFLAVALLPLVLLLCTVVQHHWLGSQYPFNRTALLMLPLGSLTVFLLFYHLQKWKPNRFTHLLPVVAAVFCGVHLLRTAQLDRTYEWGYDARTKDMVLYLKDKVPPDTPVLLGVKWLYHPATTHYLRHFNIKNITPPDYRKQMRRDSMYDFYYVMPGDTAKISPAYVPEKKFDHGGWLMRRG